MKYNLKTYRFDAEKDNTFNEYPHSIAFEMLGKNGAEIFFDKSKPYSVVIDFRYTSGGKYYKNLFQSLSKIDEFEDLQNGKAKLIIDESPENPVFKVDFYDELKSLIKKYTNISIENFMLISGDINIDVDFNCLSNPSYWQDVETAVFNQLQYGGDEVKNAFDLDYIKMSNKFSEGYLKPYKYAYHIFRPRLSRLMLFKKLKDDNFLKDGYLSFPKLDNKYQQLGDNYEWNGPQSTNAIDGTKYQEYDWFKLYDEIDKDCNLPLKSDVAPMENFRDEELITTAHQVSYSPSQFLHINLYTQIYTEVQVETYVSIAEETPFRNLPTLLTEKTFRPFAMGIPGFIYNGVGSYEYIKENFGFYVGDDYIDLSFDKIKNDQERFEAFYKSLKSFISKPREEIEMLYRKHYDKWINNHDIFYKHLRNSEVSRISKSIGEFINE